MRLSFVHHTENPNGYAPFEVPAMLRAIFLFHRDVQGWNDIGYNFVIDLFGRIFEARAGGIDEPVVGAQAGGYNTASTGIAVLGDFSSQPISAAAAHALQRLLSWKLGLHGVPIRGHVTVHVDPAGAQYSRFPAHAAVTLPRVAGHRDADMTICPGDALYRELPVIRTRASALAGAPAVATIALRAANTEGEPLREGEAGAGEAGSVGAGEAGGTGTGEAGGIGEGGGSGAGESEAGGTGTSEASGIEEGEAGGATHRLAGRLTVPGSGPISGGQVEVQVRSVSHRGERVREATIATAITAADGSWSVPVNVVPPPRRRRSRKRKHPLPPPPLTPVRALFKGGKGVPATVSQPLDVPGTLTAA